MNSRDEIPFSIENLLITDDAQFESLTEEEQDRFAKFCIEKNPHEFERCIQLLLKDYNRILIRADLLETEDQIIEKSEYLQEHVKIFNSRFEEILNNLKQHMLKSHNTLRTITNQERAHQLKTIAEINARSAKKELDSIKLSIMKVTLFIEQWSTDKTNLHKASTEEAKKELEYLQEQLKTATEKVEQTESEVEIAGQNVLNANKNTDTTTSLEDITKTSEDQANSSVYDFPVFTVQLIQANMLNQLQQLSQQTAALTRQSKAMQEITANLGIVKIQQRLKFCMNVVMTIPYEKLTNKYDSVPYCSITKSFGEFWFYYGKKLFPDTSKSSKKEKKHKKDLQSLVFYFMSNPVEDIPEVKLCLIQILKYGNKTEWLSWKDIHKLSLEEFAKKYPNQFIHLYQYLFDIINLFGDQVIELAQQKHIYVIYNQAVFQLYASIAYQQIDNPDYSKQLKNQAKNGLFSAFENGVIDAEYWIVKYFLSDFNAKIALAIIYFKNGLQGQHDLSAMIYSHLKRNIFEIDTAIYELFFYWMTFSNKDIRLFAANRIELLAKSNDTTAWSVLLRNANYNVEYAVMISRIALAGDHAMKNQALQALMFHPNQDDKDIAFNKFLVTKDLFNELNVSAVVTAAKQGHEEASQVLIENYENNQELRHEVHNQITNTVEKRPLLLLNLLKDLYLKKSPIVSLYDIDNLQFFNVFFHYISSSLTSKEEAEILKNLDKYASQKFLNAYEALLFYATDNINAAFILAKNLLQEINSGNHLIKEYASRLIKLFYVYHENNPSDEKGYYLYVLENHAYGKSSPDYLIRPCQQAFLPAIQELDIILNSSPCDLDILRIDMYKDILQNLAATQSPGAYAAAEALCVRHISERSYSSAGSYFEICCKSENGPQQICSRLVKQKCMNEFLRTCNKDTYDLIPEEYKSSKFPQVSVKTRISLFQNLPKPTLRQERQQPSEANMGL